MGRKSYEKGRRAEYEVRDLLRGNSFWAERRLLSGGGSHEGKADVVVYVNHPELQRVDVEVKKRKSLPSWFKDLVKKGDVTFIRENRGEWLVIMPATFFIKLLKLIQGG